VRTRQILHAMSSNALLNPRYSNSTASYDMVSNICQTPSHGMFPVWDGQNGAAPAPPAPTALVDDPAFVEDGLCHIAVAADGARAGVYTRPLFSST